MIHDLEGARLQPCHKTHPQEAGFSPWGMPPATYPYSVILSEAHRGPRRAFCARWGGERSRRTPRVSRSPTRSHAFSHDRALASRYPKASALGLITAQEERGFSPWGMLSLVRTPIPEVNP
jgi:hypothetical protein